MTPTTGQRRLSKYRRTPGAFAGFVRTTRDVEILKLVHDYRVVEARHVLALIPGNRRRLQKRLQGLWQREYLDRLSPPSRFRVLDDGRPAGGSEPFAYVLTAKGAAAIAAAEGITVEELGFDPRVRTHTDERFLRHEIMKTTFRATLELAIHLDDELEFAEWRDELEVRDTITVRHPDGQTKTHHIAPDGYVLVREGGVARNFFLECDRGTERNARILPKFQNFWLYTAPRSHFYTTYPNAENRLILFVCSDETRLRAMRATLAKVDPEQRRRLAQFWFTLESRYDLGRPETLLGPIWQQGPRTGEDEAAGRPDTAKALFGK